MARKTAFTQGGAAASVAARVNQQMKQELLVVGSDIRFQIEKITSGSLAIDRLLLGGFSRGRHTEIFGDWQVGKSLLVYMTLVAAQERGEVCAIVDGEGVFDESWFEQLGGDIDSLIKYRPTTANELAKVLQLFVYHDDEVAAVDVVGIDSVASMLPREELAYDFEEGSPQPAGLARLMSMLLRNVTSQNDKTTFLWTNQWREKISHIPGQKSTPGGLSLGFYASTRIEMRKAEAETEIRKIALKGTWSEKKVKRGQWVTCTLKKDKTGATPETAKALLLDYEKGQFDRVREIIDLGMDDGLIERVGDYYSFHVPGWEDERKVHGVTRLAKRLHSDEELATGMQLLIEARTEVLAEGSDGDDTSL
jgi:protein RecA